MTTSRGFLLGIDGGGTSTVAWVSDEIGTVLGRGWAGPSNAKAVGKEAARAALSEAITLAFRDAGSSPRQVAVACLGLAGFGRPEDKALLTAWATEERWASRLVLVTDGDLVVAAGTPEGWGVGVIAGTGSIALGRSADGRTARAGGWGHLIGDEGSGYAIALAGLRLVARRADGRDRLRGGDDPLTQRLCAGLGVETASEIIGVLHSPAFDRARIAGLAPVVSAAAEEDPEVVVTILHPAGRALAEMALAAARSLDYERGPLPLALAGGFLLGTPAVAEALISEIASAGYDVVATKVPEPVSGAILLAARE